MHKDEPEMFEKIPISSSIDCGYRDGKLTAVYFWIQHPYLNEVQSVIDLLTKRYGKYRQLSYGYGSETYIWETDKVYALLDMWQNHTAEVVICDREFGSSPNWCVNYLGHQTVANETIAFMPRKLLTMSTWHVRLLAGHHHSSARLLLKDKGDGPDAL